MKVATCAVSKKEFEISDLEIELRKKHGFENLPTTAPWVRLRERGAFWNHWNLHRRKCDRTGKMITSVFSEKCPYPVWHKDEWMKNADPPFLFCHSGLDSESENSNGEILKQVQDDKCVGGFDFSRPFFDQAWELFQKCPVPHNVGAGSQNCEYSDDWWYGKNCYLCHSGVENEDLRYCYRTLRTKDSQFCVFTFDSELCVDTTNCARCFDVRYALHCRNCNSSAFLYDCRGCSDCLFCFNLRNKKYCIGNRQLSKEQFLAEKKKWNFASRKTYDLAKKHFHEMMKNLAWHRAIFVDKSYDSTGNFLENCKKVKNSFFISELEDSVNCVRGGYSLRSCLDALGLFKSELLFSTAQVQDQCYSCAFSHNLGKCRFCTYCQYCFQCENCFGCSGLVGKKFHIFNKKYSPEEFKKLRTKIVQKMKSDGEWGQFFPGKFAANPYDESWGSFYFPLSDSDQKKFGFRENENVVRKNSDFFSPDEIPDFPEKFENFETPFWDSVANRPFKILPDDVLFAKKMQVSLPNEFYIRRIQENFRWLFFNGNLRETTCARSGENISTTWPTEFDGRILSELEYLKIVGG
ncbi:hypothetical protein HN954_04950 [bacterium]|jgi:hypothetical protein|nr:hypothetical protein [bacterium]MBT6831810.1 hypothetical protein [bacterium]MBT6996743.1 hypothetical protein [bacterium]MBT7772191.1 hypothetical protein [bacterium]